MAWKYIIVQVGNTEVPIIFPERLVHVMMVDAIKDVFVAEAKLVAGAVLPPESFTKLRDDIKVVSAGQLEMIVRHAGGHSETLNLVSRLDDKDAINMHPYTHGILPCNCEACLHGDGH